MKVHGRKLEIANAPETQPFHSHCFLICLVGIFWFGMLFSERFDMWLDMLIFQDVSSLDSDERHMVALVPISSIKVVCPPDGLPSVDDWLTTCISFLFSGSRLHREPLDLYVLNPSDPTQAEPHLGVKKGFTRLKLDTKFSHMLIYCFVFVMCLQFLMFVIVAMGF